MIIPHWLWSDPERVAEASCSVVFSFFKKIVKDSLSSVRPPLTLTTENKIDRMLKAATNHRTQKKKSPAVLLCSLASPSFRVLFWASVSCGALTVEGCISWCRQICKDRFGNPLSSSVASSLEQYREQVGGGLGGKRRQKTDWWWRTADWWPEEICVPVF